ncbi:hypothetical protein [Streptomyces sp. NPDC091371]|uniref:hypothetical protein n=1 Tax=Streptomyces sp. NPDC091371 TaxID=3155303 RepID=UPI0034321FEE
MRPHHIPYRWPTDKLTALRLGRRLVAEVPASRADRRAFVDVTPQVDERDSQARRQGWVRSDADRVFRLAHWEYDGERIDGFDYDIGAVLVRAAAAGSEAELTAVLRAWHVRPPDLVHPWDSEDPR